MHFENSDFSNLLIIGDSGYAVSNYLLTPLHYPANREEDLYNELQIKTKNVVKCSYSMWKRCVPILAIGIKINIEHIESIIVVTAILYNIALFLEFRHPSYWLR